MREEISRGYVLRGLRAHPAIKVVDYFLKAILSRPFIEYLQYSSYHPPQNYSRVELMSQYKIEEVTRREDLDGIVDVIWAAMDGVNPSHRIF